ncbi:YtxH domain-containing protein [Carnobacterium funditum]|uniref:YtxH domain-containing protein n=1 Tax=Carnobacterium funditum TaxID=2752 RepID=UPI000558F09C|nr:YtxH domain-containing protein [Carnobacterium funditum]
MSKNNFMGTLFVGAAAAFTALLFAPKSGRELRSDLKEEALSMKKQAMEKVNELADEVKVAYQEVEEEINYDNQDLAETIESIEDDLNAKATFSDDSNIKLDPMNIPNETDHMNPEYPPLEDLDSQNDLEINDRREKI